MPCSVDSIITTSESEFSVHTALCIAALESQKPTTSLQQSAETAKMAHKRTILSTTFLESLAASGAQLALVRLETIHHRIIVLILHVATVSEHIGSTSPLLLRSTPVPCRPSFLGGHAGR
jgi:hypothetical protein